jgi:hypothetical protein
LRDFLPALNCLHDEHHNIDGSGTPMAFAKRTVRREILTRDRNQPNRYLAVVFFDSHDSAMQNSKLPETQEFAGQYPGVTDSIAFHDLDAMRHGIDVRKPRDVNLLVGDRSRRRTSPPPGAPPVKGSGWAIEPRCPVPTLEKSGEQA